MNGTAPRDTRPDRIGVRLLRLLPRQVRQSLRLKINAVFTACLLAISAFVWFEVPNWVVKRNIEEAARHARSLAAVTAYSVSAALEFEDSTEIAEVLRATRLEGDVAYLIITDAADSVVASWRRSGDPIRRLATADLDHDGSAGVQRASVPVLNPSGQEIGRVHLGQSLARLERQAGDIRLRITIVTALLLLGGVAGISLLSHVLTRPLQAVVATAERIAGGDLAARAPIASEDEVSILSASFNSMVEKLAAAQIALKESNRTLEARVVARTQALRHEAIQRQQAEAARLESERRFRAMFESAALGIALFERDGVTRDVNAALLGMLQAGDSPAPREFVKFFAGDSASQAVASFRLVADGRLGSDQFEAHLAGPNGAVICTAHVVLSGAAGSEGIKYVIATVEDISEQRRLEEMYRQSQKLEAIGQLAGGVAHDFNNLLTTINGIAELMLTDLEPGTALHADARQVREAGLRAAGLTRQLLAFSRKQVMRTEPVDFNEVVHGVTQMLARLLTEDVSCTTELRAGLPAVRADRAQLEQVVLNLCVNAKDAMPQGGRLSIATNIRELGTAEAQGLEVSPGEFVELAVSDTGAGMDEATQQRIFEPFFTTKPIGQGTGLGLATVYGITRQSGGCVMVESAPGRGATFRVLLPALDSTASSTAVATVVAEPGGTGTILVIEDEEQVRDLFCRVLRRAGYLVLPASNGLEALSVSERFEGTIDLVISDVIMPEMNGPEAISHLLARRSDLRILYISGYTRDLALRKGLSERQVNFLEKPVSPTMLRRAVHNLICAGEDVLTHDELVGAARSA